MLDGNQQLLTAFLRTLSIFKEEVNLDINITQVEIYLCLLAGDGLSIKQITEKYGVKIPSASRTVRALTDFKRPGVPGYGLIELRNDPQDFRVKRLYLSKKGLALRDKLAENRASAGASFDFKT